MSDSPLVLELIQLIRTTAKVRPEVAILPESRLVEDVGIDSLDLVGVFVQVQDAFGVEINDDDVPSLTCVSDLAAYIASRRSSAAA